MNIKSFSGLRFFLSLFVFFTHCELIAAIEKCNSLYTHLNLGGYSVTVFLMLSGFCIYLGYNSRFDSLSMGDIKIFIKKRFVKLYPAFIISNLLVFAVQLIFNFCMSPHSIMTILRHIYHSIYSYLAVAFMVQAWIPSLATAGNSASWFVSTLFFSYLVSPFIIHYYNKLKVKCNFSIILIVSTLLCFYAVPRIRMAMGNSLKMSQENLEYFCYTFPLFRLFDFFFGIVLCDLFFRTESWIKENISSFIFSALEILLIIAFFFIKDFQKLKACRILLYTLLIYVFAMDKGIVSRLFATKPAVWFGKTSLYFYLFHFPILSLPLFVFYKLKLYFLTLEENKALTFALVYYVIGFILSLLASYIYEKACFHISEKLKDREMKTVPKPDSC